MRRMITGKDAEIFKNVAADGTKTVVSGDLDVSGNILKNGQPFSGGTKLYKHEISGILDNNANARLIIISTSSDLINDRYKLMYNTEPILRINYCGNITSSQRELENVVNVSFNTSAYKLTLIYFNDSNPTTPAQLQINASGFTDTVTEL